MEFGFFISVQTLLSLNNMATQEKEVYISSWYLLSVRQQYVYTYIYWWMAGTKYSIVCATSMSPLLPVDLNVLVDVMMYLMHVHDFFPTLQQCGFYVHMLLTSTMYLCAGATYTFGLPQGLVPFSSCSQRLISSVFHPFFFLKAIVFFSLSCWVVLVK